MAPKPGRLAALMIGSSRDPDAESGDRARARAARGILDAIRADSETALDTALGDWCHEYNESEPDENEGTDSGDEGDGAAEG